MRDHNVFHVSLLKKYVHDPNHIIDWNAIEVEPKGEFQVDPMCILEWKETMLQNQVVSQVKVQWKCLGLDETSWELQDVMRKEHPFVFDFENIEDYVIPRGRGM